MRVTLLGTGSADGWPNAFCRCASCTGASATGTVRTPTSVLVDDRVLLDCGPETPRQAVRAGRRLDGVRLLWVGHAHPDHSAPMALLSRSWAEGAGGPLVVAGPAAAVEPWRAWLPPGGDARVVPVAAGDAVEVGGYRLTALSAAHGDAPGDALLALLAAPDGTRLLYGADTGPLPAPTVAALDGPLDLLLLEETFGTRGDLAARGDHLDLAGFEREVARLRDAGAVTPDTAVVAVHLSHHNPPGPALDARLAAVGARAGHDGQVLDTAGPLPHRTLVVGGARSGKSRTAERLLAAEPNVEYIATGYPPAPDDPEWAARVAHHRARRPPGWRTVETLDLAAALARPGPPVLVDCLTLWLTRTLDTAGAWDDAPGGGARAEADVHALAAAWRSSPRRAVAVSNEVGSGVVPATASGRLFRDLQGRLNAEVGDASDTVLLVAAGRALPLERV